MRQAGGPDGPCPSRSAISKYTTSVSGRLGITDNSHNRRVLAVLTYLSRP